MFDWLVGPDDATGPLSVAELAVRLSAALASGLIVAGIYRVSHGRSKDESPVLFTTLVLLCLLIAMVSMVIGNSVARAFSLVGALSIVRFRTVVDDTRDTAFVIFAVVVGMAVGAGLYLVPLVGVPLVAVAAVGLSWWGPAAVAGRDERPCTISVRVGLGRDPETLLGAVLRSHLVDLRLLSVQTAKQGSSLEVAYQGKLPAAEKLSALVTQLNQLDGVQNVEARAG